MIEATDVDRAAKRIEATVDRIRLDLTGLRVITEAATGPYVVTPVIAAAAGAEVVAATKSTRYGTVEDVRRQTESLARRMGVQRRIEIVESLAPAQIADADVVTNSSHLRPLDATFIDNMKPGSAIPLMYESWEFRPQDVDLDRCRANGVLVAGTNERHPHLRVFDYLGLLAVHGLLQCHVPVANSRLLVVSDNPFQPYIVQTLRGCGGAVEILASDPGSPAGTDLRVRRFEDSGAYDAVIIADTPTGGFTLGGAADCKYRAEDIGEFDTVVQIWGDVDRSALPDVRFHPSTPPPPRHMGVLLSELGIDPIVRLQAGGLKVGELLRKGAGKILDPEDVDYVQPIGLGEWHGLERANLAA